MSLSLLGEQDSYDEDEVRDAGALLANPDDEEVEDVAHSMRICCKRLARTG